ncbi:transcription factor FER-LIKE IRON DEFICIENCY-INDUCED TRANSCRIPTION FACTOR-like [Wolffia australiana]
MERGLCQFDQMDCLLNGGFGGFGQEDLCSSVVEQVLGFYTDEGCHRFMTPEAEEDDSSGTTGGRSRSGRDRARTLVSERRRRGRMKEKLYELRSIVPNITKMDKASIIGDAIIYVKDLQRQAETLAEEIAALEASAKTEETTFPTLQILHTLKPETPPSSESLPKGEMVEISAFHLGNKRFLLRLVCKRGDETAAALFRAMDRLSFVRLESSTLSTFSMKHELTMTVEVEGDREMDESALKIWVMTAMLEERIEIPLAANL